MGEIVGAFGIPHNPHFPAWVAEGHPLSEEIRRLYGPLAAGLQRVAPDQLLYITSDHYNMFFEILPIFAIGVAASARGASDYPELDREFVLDADLAGDLHRRLVRDGFDVPPLVPIYVNAFIRPNPTAQRCLALGQAIRSAIEASPQAGRVAVAGSGSFSLEIGGPRMSEDSHTGVPDPVWLDRVVELLRTGDRDTLVAEADDEQLWAAGNAGGELLDWITLLGTFDAGPPEFLDVQPQFGHAFAFWPLEEHR
jgi:hypothetical protein